jgi:branched-chain amino acid transport system substrate-binding protein
MSLKREDSRVWWFKNVFAVSVVLFLVLIGCSNRNGLEESESRGNTRTGNVFSPVADPAEIRLGCILPETGELAKYGRTSRAAIEIAIDEIGHDPDYPHTDFVAIFEDDGMSSKQGISAARKLLDVDKVRVIIGPLASSITKAVAPLAERAGVVLLSPGSSAPGIREIGKFIFRNCLSDVYEGKKMSNFVFTRLGLHRIAIYYIKNDFGEGLRMVFKSNFQQLGGNIVSEEGFQQQARDHRSSLIKIKETNPEGVYLIGYDEMVSVFRQAKELGFETQWLGTTFLNDPDLVAKMGNDADSTVLAAWAYNPNSPAPRIRRFASLIREKTGGLEPDVFCANAYDAVYLIREAVQKGGPSSEGIQRGLLEIKGFEGVTGKTEFDSMGEVQKDIDFKKIIEDKLVPY